MAEALPKRPSHFSLRLLFLTVALIGIFIAIWVLPFVDMHRSIKSFPARHAEATLFIQAVYRYHAANGQWPDKAMVSGLSPVPPEWTYSEAEPTDPQSAPVLILNGPYHTLLAYRFRLPSDENFHRQWVVSWEGDKTEFEASEQYRP